MRLNLTSLYHAILTAGFILSLAPMNVSASHKEGSGEIFEGEDGGNWAQQLALDPWYRRSLEIQQQLNADYERTLKIAEASGWDKVEAPIKLRRPLTSCEETLESSLSEEPDGIPGPSSSDEVQSGSWG